MRNQLVIVPSPRVLLSGAPLDKATRMDGETRGLLITLALDLVLFCGGIAVFLYVRKERGDRRVLQTAGKQGGPPTAARTQE